MKTIYQLKRAAFRINRVHAKAFKKLTKGKGLSTNEVAFWRQKMVLGLQARIELSKELVRRHVGIEGVRSAAVKKFTPVAVGAA